jgi:hypothetical protein
MPPEFDHLSEALDEATVPGEALRRAPLGQTEHQETRCVLPTRQRLRAAPPTLRRVRG